jgi:periplasmic protein TonB
MTVVSHLVESRRSRIGRWAGAAVVVCGLHVGAALALMYLKPDETVDEPAGAVSVEMTPMPSVMPVNSEDAAIGPDADAAEKTPEASKQVVEKVQKDIPPVEPSPAPEPEIVLPKAQPEEMEQPKEEEPKEAVSEKKASAEEEVDLTTRVRRVEAPPAPNAGQAKGLSPALARAQADWQRGLSERLKQYKRYPHEAQRRGVRGQVIVRFKVDDSGQLVFSEITRSSGSPILDEEALALLKRASPFQAPPPGAELDYTLPIRFGVK